MQFQRPTTRTTPQGLEVVKNTQSGLVVPSEMIINPSFDIQTALTQVSQAGGGSVFMLNGTYLPNNDIVMPNNVALKGQSGDGVIIDFDSQAYQIRAEGTNEYNAGTVSATNNSTTVTGSATAWTSDMIGRSILITGTWFVITNVATATSLTIELPYDAATVSGTNYVIADPSVGVLLKDFSVQNSTHPQGAILYKNNSAGDQEGVSVFDSTIGFNYLSCSFVAAEDILTIGCGIGINVSHGGVWTFTDFATYSSTTANIVLDKFYNVSFNNCTISSSTGNGITITNSYNMGIYDLAVTTNGGKGIEITSSSHIEIFGAVVQNNTSDGIKLTSDADRISIHNVSLLTNGGYGINVAAASDDKNTISSCQFSGNVSGTVNNSGTATINVNGQT